MRTDKKIFTIVLLVLGLAWAGITSAHQPRIEFNSNPTIDNPVPISNPGVSQAFYGDLKGSPQYYEIKLDSPLDFYFGVLVPDVPGIGKNVSAGLIIENSPKSSYAAFLDASRSDWNIFYEEFAGDNYFFGPDTTINLPAGNYLIKVFNPDNVGKYVLVVGKEEVFPPSEWLSAAIKLPLLKTQFFEKPIWSLWEGKIGKYLVIGYLIFIILVIGAIYLIVKKLVARK